MPNNTPLRVRFVIAILGAFLLWSGFPAEGASAQESMRVMIDGNYLSTEIALVEKDSQVWLPADDLVQALEFETKWNDTQTKMEASNKKRKIVFTLNKETALVDGKRVSLPKPMEIVTGHAMMSVKTFQRCFNCEVTLDAQRRLVLINTPFQPVSIFTFDHYLTYDKIPEKVVSMNSHTTEVLMALGLGPKIVGTAFNNVDILPKYKEAFDRIPKLAEKYPSFEVLLDTGADFVYGRSSVFTSSYKCATMEEMIQNGIKPYVAKASYTKNADFNDVFEDFVNLGKIFNIENRTALFMEGLKNRIAETARVVNATRPVTVFVYDFGTKDAFTAGKSLETYIIQTAGGKNVFDDIDKTWAHVNWEIVVDRNPDVIVINDYGKTSLQEKIDFLKSSPILKETRAVKDDRFVAVPLSSVFPGIRIAQAVEDIARGLHPEMF
jgi:iron complex transport system substrate-binding protein